MAFVLLLCNLTIRPEKIIQKDPVFLGCLNRYSKIYDTTRQQKNVNQNIPEKVGGVEVGPEIYLNGRY